MHSLCLEGFCIFNADLMFYVFLLENFEATLRAQQAAGFPIIVEISTDRPASPPCLLPRRQGEAFQ